MAHPGDVATWSREVVYKSDLYRVDEAERSRLWKLAIAAYPPYAEYQERTTRRIPVFIAERS
jgi:F420H(2)-dependent quinone reductase